MFVRSCLQLVCSFLYSQNCGPGIKNAKVGAWALCFCPQRKSRIVCKLVVLLMRNEKYEERMKLLNLETLEARRNKLDMIFYSKVINNEVQINSNNIPKRVHNINTRFSNKLNFYPLGLMSVEIHFLLGYRKFFLNYQRKLQMLIPQNCYGLT